MKKVGIIGWRGMVGSVLLERMIEEQDFANCEPFFFSTSQGGQDGPKINGVSHTLLDANSVDVLKEMDIIISCQGGDYTKAIHPQLRKAWNGYWIDAASALRMEKDSVIILDPINDGLIKNAITKGCKDFIGGNCTVSLMLMAVGGLFKEGLVEWMSSMTYQAASGGGARHMKELLTQYQIIGEQVGKSLNDSILDLDRKISNILTSDSLPTDCFQAPLALNLIPWIDSPVEGGKTREEWKAYAETNKILGLENNPIPIDGTCVRVGAMRSHAQGLTIKLKKSASLDAIEDIIRSSNDWVEIVPNTPEDTRDRLGPKYASGSLRIPVGRLRKMTMGDDFLNAFTVGDQILWGAAEPLRRMLNYLV